MMSKVLTDTHTRQRAGAAWVSVASLLVSILGGCHSPPQDACQPVRMRWPYLEFDPSDDVSSDDGLQIELSLITGLKAGTPAKALVSRGVNDGDEESTDEILSEAMSIVDDDGRLVFSELDVPDGQVLLAVESETECGVIRSTRSTFVWDQEGQPRCVLGIDGEQFNDGDAFRVLDASADSEPLTEGLQAQVRVETGRSDMNVRVFITDETRDLSSEISSLGETSPESSLEVVLQNGFYQLRALCEWPSEEKVFSSSTLRYQVDEDASQP